VKNHNEIDKTGGNPIERIRIFAFQIIRQLSTRKIVKVFMCFVSLICF